MSYSFRGGPHDAHRLLLKTLSFLFICFEHVTRVPGANFTRYKRVSVKNNSLSTTAAVTPFAFEEGNAATTYLSSQSWPLCAKVDASGRIWCSLPKRASARDLTVSIYLCPLVPFSFFSLETKSSSPGLSLKEEDSDPTGTPKGEGQILPGG